MGRARAQMPPRSRVHVRVEHVFGHMATAMKGCDVRTIGIARACAKPGRETIASTISRLTFPMGLTPACVQMTKKPVIGRRS